MPVGVMKNWSRRRSHSLSLLLLSVAGCEAECSLTSFASPVPGYDCHSTARSLPTDPQDWDNDSVRTALTQLLRQTSQSDLSRRCHISQVRVNSLVMRGTSPLRLRRHSLSL